ncbi:hypothetical protein V8D89_006293 [Ganoderma adspersum]
MSETLYAALVFDHHCFACGRIDGFWVDYALRVRMCERCYKENVIEGNEVLQSLPEFKALFRNVENVQLRDPDWDEATSDPDPAFFFHYLNCEAPQPEAPPAASAEPGLPKPNDQLVTEIRLREQREEAARDARIRTRYTYFAEGWCVEAVEERCCDPDTLPNRYDAVWVWEDLILQDDARAPLDDDVLMNELAGADEFLEGYPESVVNSLILDYMAAERRRSAAANCGDESQGGGEGGNGSMKKGKGKGKGKGQGGGARHKSADPEVILRHPTALFRCGDCGDYPYAWPRINGHWRERHPDTSVWTTREGDSEEERAFNAEVLENEEEDAPMWIDDHELASCIRLVPERMDTSQAAERVHADTNTRTRINTVLGQCPEKSRPVCRVCEALTPDDWKDSTLFLPEDADTVVYHMQAKWVIFVVLWWSDS